MKRRILWALIFGAVAGCSYLGFFLPSKTLETRTNSSITSLNQRLFTALFTTDEQAFRQLFSGIMAYKSIDDINAIFSAKNDSGYTLLSVAIILGSLDRLSFIFDVLTHCYGTNKAELANQLNCKNFFDHGIFSVTMYSANRRVIRYVVQRALSLLEFNPKLSYPLFLAGAGFSARSPLQLAIETSSSYGVKLLVKEAQQIFGASSIEFKSIINYVSPDGTSVFSSAVNPVDHFFLKPYVNADAIKLQSPEPVIKDAHDLGIQLLRAANQHKMKQFKKILQDAEVKFKGNAPALTEFLKARDEAGWNILMHMAAAGHLDYIELLIEFMTKAFQSKDAFAVFEIFSASDFHGRTPLHLAISRREFKIALRFFEIISRMISDNLLFFALMTTTDELNGFTPLHTATITSFETAEQSKKIIEFMMFLVRQRFGKDSYPFELFINARDYNDATPCSYVINAGIRKIFEAAGGVDTEMDPLPEPLKL